jgi:DNA primase
MAGYIPQDVIEDVRSKADIVDIVNEYIPLKKSGRNYKALCPFHNEKTPSFMVSPAKQIYHCFGCHEGGNVFTFIMNYEHISFGEALKKVAAKVGVKLPQISSKANRNDSLFNKIIKANELAMSFYHKQLFDSSEATAAKSYLKKRGFDKATAEQFKLGYASSQWRGLYDYLQKAQIEDNVMIKAGLISVRQGGGYCDKFRKRLMFPIYNAYDKVVGFGARVLEIDKMPKYLNSADTPVFSKGKNLYGINWAKKTILDKDRVIIVEGYTDCIRAHEKGFKETVATLGTALTPDQTRALKRYTRNFVIIYDADEAGEVAALRNLDVLLPEDIVPKIAVLPKGKDPDDYLKSSDKDAFERIVTNARNIFDFKLQLLFKKYDSSSALDKVEILNDFLPTLSAVSNAVLRSTYIKRLAEALDVKEDDVIGELKKYKSPNYKTPNVSTPVKKKKKVDLAEKILLVIMLEDNNKISKVKEHLGIDDFISDNMRELISTIYELNQDKKEVKPASLVDELQDEDSKLLLTSVFLDVPDIKDIEKNLNDCIVSIKRKKIDEEIKNVNLELKTAQRNKQEDELEKLTKRVNVLLAQKRELLQKENNG